MFTSISLKSYLLLVEMYILSHKSAMLGLFIAGCKTKHRFFCSLSSLDLF